MTPKQGNDAGQQGTASKPTRRPLAGVSDAAVRKATGKGWDEWIKQLDAMGAQSMSHKAVVKALEAGKHIESSWWRQQVTVGYEHARGIRTVGETADAGFQIGVQRTLSAGVDTIWRKLMRKPWRDAWLGPVSRLRLSKGAAYETDDGTRGEIRSVVEGRRLRLTWQPSEFAAPTTLQITISGDERRTAVRFHHEKLSSAAARDAMRKRWRGVLDDFERSLGGASLAT